MKKSIFAFLTALLVVTGCMGCIVHIGNIRYRGDMETLENAGPSAGFPGLLTITARAAETAGTLLVVDNAHLLSEREKDQLIN